MSWFDGEPVTPVQKQVTVVSSNLLTNEEIEMVKQYNKQLPEELFKAPSDIEVIMNKCTHRDNTTGKFTLDPCTDKNGNPALRCSICGTIFHYMDPADDTTNIRAQRAADQMHDVYESVKVNMFNAPEKMKNVFIADFINQQMPKMLRITGEKTQRIKEAFINQNGINTNGTFDASAVYNGFQNGGFNSRPTIIPNNPPPQQYAPNGYNPGMVQNQYQQPAQQQMSYNQQAAQVAGGGYAAASNPIAGTIIANPQVANPVPQPTAPAPQVTNTGVASVPVNVSNGVPTSFNS